jgi:hydroxyethylthiazole kinase-like uncharacterized protein yjeF
MQPLLTSAQIHEADAYTIAHEPIVSIDLMERASTAFVGRFMEHFGVKQRKISVYCGTGNNGGDGLAIARILSYHYRTGMSVKIARFTDRSTAEFDINLQRLIETEIPIIEISKGDLFPGEDGDLIIVALLGTGLNKPLSGDFERLVNHINGLNKTVVSVDVPAGFFADGDMPAGVAALKADLVITFQQPKINFLMPESKPYIKHWEAVDIGLNEDFIQSVCSPYQLVEKSDIKQMLQPRQRFSNKGTYGHALLIAGQPETMGAALLCSSASVYAGSGLTTAFVPLSGLTALNTYMPEVMAIVRGGPEIPSICWDNFSAIAIGPGLGKGEEALALLRDILSNYKKPLVIDADAINLLASHRELCTSIPQNSILTPHMKEFDRLFGEHDSWWKRMQTGIRKAQEMQIYILLKNDYTLTITPQGQVFFNTTGNPAMATGGMGDVLTGIITSLLAQRYTPQEAAIIGAYLHGLSGDELALPNKANVVLPTAVAAHLPAVMVGLMA